VRSKPLLEKSKIYVPAGNDANDRLAERHDAVGFLHVPIAMQALQSQVSSLSQA
jgi:hypothetical protein